MANNAPNNYTPSEALIDHSSLLKDDFATLIQNETYSDVTLMVEGKRIFANKTILASRSEYFRALFYGGFRESQEGEIRLDEIPLPAFEMLLEYIYTGQINAVSSEHLLLLDVLGLAHQYGISALESSISSYLQDVLNATNVCNIYRKTKNLSLPFVSQKCLNFMDNNALEVIRSDGFLSLSSSSLKNIISRDSFCVPEIDLFKAVCRWMERNSCHEKTIWVCLRFHLMTLKEIFDVVVPSGYFSPEALLNMIKEKINKTGTDLNLRASLIPEQNVATLELGASVLTGEMPSALLNGVNCNYDDRMGYTYQKIDSDNTHGILIQLGKEYFINHFRMLLWDLDFRSYRYYIEVSLNGTEWITVVDYRSYACRSWQNLFFEPRAMKYIRIVGTHNTANRSFHVVSFECMFTRQPLPLKDDLIFPLHNVATLDFGACVIKGRDRKALLDGDKENYCESDGYTYHSIHGGSIIVQLSQPYVLESVAILLWDRDGRYYSYYVAVSVDNKHWNIVWDKRQELCQSWQFISFSPRPVVFIQIVGTANTANESFHCVHFECPAEISFSDRGDVEQISNIHIQKTV